MLHSLHSRNFSNRVPKFASCAQTPLIAGTKKYAVGDPTGCCFIGYVNVGFGSDSCLRRWMDCPLGRTPRLVLFMLVSAWTEFAQQTNGRVAFLFADNYYLSLLLSCLVSHKVFGFGTVKRNNVGVLEAFKFLDTK